MGEQTSVPSRKPFAWAGIAIAAVAVVVAGAYFFDIPQSSDNLTGTVTPAERYRAPQQVTAADVKLGDQSVPQLLQSDVVVKLIRDPQFQALARSPRAMEALSALAAYPQALQALASYPRALEAISSNAKWYGQYAGKPDAFAAMAAKTQALQGLAADRKAMDALSAAPKAFEAIAARHDAFAALAAMPRALDALAAHSSALAALSARPAALDAAMRASMDAAKK